MAEYDFIVVGTGAGGSVMANRLSENPDVKVLALEAGGPDIPENVHIAPAWATLWKTEVDWNYKSVPQPGLGGRQIDEPRGKLPGGSSDFYIMMHIRGHRADYDNWAYSGCPGWSYDECLPWFQKSEGQEDDTNPTAGHDGPLFVGNAKLHGPNPISERFIEACEELGFPRTEDFNGPQMEGAGWHHINVKDGRRFGTLAAYLEPARSRPNLTISTNSMAARLVITNGRCTGVEYLKDGVPFTDSAKEVIVCAGAMESPKLLLLSGVGPAAHLTQVGVPVIWDLPGVGENFHNHVLAPIVAATAQPMPPPNQNLSESALFCKSAPGWVGPDMQIACVTGAPGIPDAITILPGVVRPLSRGWVRLASADPMDKPLINPNYLGVAVDRERLIDGVELVRRIYATKALSPHIAQEVFPGPAVSTREEISAFLTTMGGDSYHHQVGSCKMGLDAMSVVNPRLQVHGLEGVRVADASVMPVVPSGNCHAGIVMIAERGADMIKADYGI